MDYITLIEVLAIHEAILLTFGGAAGIRDMGALEAALFRPQTGYYDDLIQQAAALLESLVMNHCFTDGNKRTAFVATDAFLGLNGYFIDVDPEKAYAVWMDFFETHSFNYAHLEPWLWGCVKEL